jgi:hypothetical protein
MPGANLPVEAFAWPRRVDLAAHGFVVTFDLPTAGARSLFARVFVGGPALAGGWLRCLACRLIALLLGLIFGGSLHTADLRPVLIKQRDHRQRRGTPRDRSRTGESSTNRDPRR